MRISLLLLLIFFSVDELHAKKCLRVLREQVAATQYKNVNIEYDPDVYYDSAHSFPALVYYYPSGTVIAYLNKTPLHGKGDEAAYVAAGAIRVRDPKYKRIQNNSAMNCHAFAIKESGLPGFPEIFWVNEGTRSDPSSSFRVLLKSYFSRISKKDYRNGFKFSSQVKEGDLVTFVHSGWNLSSHTGIVVRVGSELWVRSKFSEGAIYDASVDFIAKVYDDWDAVEVYRRR